MLLPLSAASPALCLPTNQQTWPNQDAEGGLRNSPIFFVAGWLSSFFWISTPFQFKHLCVSTRLSSTLAVSSKFDLNGPRLFLNIPSWMNFRDRPNFSIFLLNSLRNWRMSPHPPALEGASNSLFPKDFYWLSINHFTSTSYHLGRAILTSASPPHGSEKTPLDTHLAAVSFNRLHLIHLLISDTHR